jgi:hypothetical protein
MDQSPSNWALYDSTAIEFLNVYSNTKEDGKPQNSTAGTL